MQIGYAQNLKAYKVQNFQAGRVVGFRDVVSDELSLQL